MPDYAWINAAALDRAERLMVLWLPSGRIEGREWVSLNPTRPDRRQGSFRINLESGRWADFATGDKGGDLISLFAYLNGLSQVEAARRLTAELVLDSGGGQRLSRPRADTSPWKVIHPVPGNAPPPPKAHSRHGRSSQIWSYKDQEGQLLGFIYRFELPGGDKEILPATFCEGPKGQTAWRWQSWPAPRPLYGLDRLAARPDALVLVVEGEKTADATRQLFPEMVAIATPGSFFSRVRALRRTGPSRKVSRPLR